MFFYSLIRTIQIDSNWFKLIHIFSFYLCIIIPDCKEEDYCRLPQQFSFFFHCVVLGIIAFLMFIRGCYLYLTDKWSVLNGVNTESDTKMTDFILFWYGVYWLPYQFNLSCIPLWIIMYKSINTYLINYICFTSL